jgi:PAS domain S-box-containing protein
MDTDGRVVFVNDAYADAFASDNPSCAGSEANGDRGLRARPVALASSDAWVIRERQSMEIVEALPGPRPRQFLTTRFLIERADCSPLLGGISIDLTERMAQQERLRESEARLELALDAAEMGLWDWDLSTGAAGFDDRWHRLLGLERGEVDPRIDVWQDRIHADDRAAVDEALRRHIAGDSPQFESEHRLKHRSAEYRWYLVRARVVRADAHGRPLRIAGTLIDVTYRKLAEELVRLSERKYRAIVEQQREMIVRFAVDGRITFVNEAFCRSFGRSADALVGHVWCEVMPEAERAGAVARLAELRRTGCIVRFERRIRDADGHDRWQQWSDTPITDDEGRVVEIQSVGTDVTKLRRAEFRVAHQNRVLELIARGTALPAVMDMLLKSIESQIKGVLASVLIREGPCLRNLAAPSMPVAYTAAIDGLPVAAGMGACGDAAHSGRRVIIEDVARDPRTAEFRDLLAKHGFRAIWSQPIRSTGGVILGTLAIYCQAPRAPDAHEIELVESAAHVAGIAIDATHSSAELERHRAHLEDLVAERTRALMASQERLAETQRLATIGTFAAGIAHEINNPVGSIMLSAENLLAADGRVGSDAQRRKLLTGIARDANRCSQIVKGVLQFVRGDPSEKWPVVVRDLVTRAAEEAAPYVASRQASLSVSVPLDAVEIWANPTQIEQVLVNLIRNATESGPQDGGLVIEITARYDAVETVIGVRDNGPGMARETLKRAMLPFFTTRQEAGGTGLGLSIAHGIISEHGGRLEIDSRIGAGTTVAIHIPRVEFIHRGPLHVKSADRR